MSFFMLLVVHAMAAVGLFIYSIRYRMPSGTALRWALAGLLLGFAPLGPFAWITRDDWGVGNKLVGCLIMITIEVGIVTVAISA